MSVAHPIIAVTGSSGAGTSTVKQAFSDMFRREGIKPVVIEGDSFHRYDRQTMKEKMQEYETQGKILTHSSYTPTADSPIRPADSRQNTTCPFVAGGAQRLNSH